MDSNQQNNQCGMASIMFAMLMIIIVTLLSIGFAVLVRNDQRQTLDKTLSNQASYAAETALNLKATGLRNQPGIAPNILENNDCDYDTDIVGNDLFGTNLQGVKVTCLTWDSTPEELVYNAGTKPVIVPLKPANNTDQIGSILIVWSSNTAGTEEPVLSSPDPVIDDNRLNLYDYPTLRITAVKDDAISTNSVVYINPGTHKDSFTNISSQPMPNTANNDKATILNSTCTNQGNLCAVLLTNLPGDFWNSTNGGRLSISSLGKKAQVRVYSYDVDGPGSSIIAFQASDNTPRVPIRDAQIKIDATAKSQDVIKRIVARVPIQSTTWHPGFAAMADTLCKNYRVNGTNTTEGPADSHLCPANPIIE